MAKLSVEIPEGRRSGHFLDLLLPRDSRSLERTASGSLARSALRFAFLSG